MFNILNLVQKLESYERWVIYFENSQTLAANFCSCNEYISKYYNEIHDNCIVMALVYLHPGLHIYPVTFFSYRILVAEQYENQNSFDNVT